MWFGRWVRLGYRENGVGLFGIWRKGPALCLGREPNFKHCSFGLGPKKTAGTGSEANGTAIFSDADGHKLWAYGTELKPVLAILDDQLLASLPPHLMARCGMDALIYAFEAGSNKWANPVNQAFARRALELIVPALPKFVAGDTSALADMLLGSFYAGYATENCGTAVAHNVSHAMAAFAPIHHGLATDLAFEATIDRIAAVENPALTAIAQTCGTQAFDLPN